MRAAHLYDSGRSCGAEANAAKLLAARAGFDATTKAVMTHGGMGYAREYQGLNACSANPCCRALLPSQSN